MKNLRLFVVSIFMLVFVCPVYSAGKISVLFGDVQVQSGNEEKWNPLAQGARVDTGDVIRTGDDSYAEVSSQTGTVRINANSKVRISKSMISENETDSLSMFFGSVFLKISKLGKNEGGFAVETPSAFCAVRGTEFTVASGYDGQTIVQVDKGSVSLSGNEGEVLIGPDQESEVSLGGAPTGVTRIKKRTWHEWIRQNREGMKGRELVVLRGAMRRMVKLQSDIEILEGLNEKFTREKDELAAQAEEFRKAGDKEKYREYSARAHRAKRAAYVAMNTIFFKAEKLDLIKNLAAEAYQNITGTTVDADEARNKIEEIFNRNNERYIRKIRSGDSVREKILERRRQGKSPGK